MRVSPIRVSPMRVSWHEGFTHQGFMPVQPRHEPVVGGETAKPNEKDWGATGGDKIMRVVDQMG